MFRTFDAFMLRHLIVNHLRSLSFHLGGNNFALLAFPPTSTSLLIIVGVYHFAQIESKYRHFIRLFDKPKHDTQ